jgi:glycosyltransferase involved in cell wall biosynthesis
VEEALTTARPTTTKAARRETRCLAIVPALNEEEVVGRVVSELRALEGVDVLVIDDGSTDRTAAIASQAGARVVSLPFNLGIGAAVQTGYLAALEGGYDFAVQVDGDGQHPAAAVPRLTAALTDRDADLVIGSRFLQPTDYRASPSRRVGISLFARLVSRLLRVNVTDTTSGFRAAGPRAIRLFAKAYPHDYPEVEALVVAARAGLQVVEVPVDMRQRQAGRSSITPLRSGYYMIKVLLAVLMEMARKTATMPEKTS